jgi:hypothetical protein
MRLVRVRIYRAGVICHLRHAARALACSRPSRVKRWRTSHSPYAQTIEPLAACSTPGGLVTTRLGFGNQTPSTVPFWSR